MHIGLIGGIGPAATTLYYEQVVRHCRERNIELALTMAHADVATLLENQANDDTQAQLAIYTDLAYRLRSAGAECLVIPAISGHFCFTGDDFKLPLPVIDLIESVKAELSHRQCSRVGVLGTRQAMVSALYGRLIALKLPRLIRGS